MLKKQLRFMPIHITICALLLFGTFIGTRATMPFDPIEAWKLFVIIYFPIASIGNFMLLIRSRNEKDNLRAFLIALPIMVLPFLILLLLLLLM